MRINGGDLLVVQNSNQNPVAYSLYGDGSSRTTHAVVGRTNHIFYVQLITVAVITHANAKAITFQDTTGSAILLWKFNDFTAAAGVSDTVTVNFGPHGYPLAIGQGLDIVEPGSGSVASIHVEGYFRLGTTVAFDASDSTK